MTDDHTSADRNVTLREFAEVERKVEEDLAGAKETIEQLQDDKELMAKAIVTLRQQVRDLGGDPDV